MKALKCYVLIETLFVLVTGTLSHFLYGWTGKNPVVGLFTPVNESVWEHMKLLFFPMLLSFPLLLYRFGEDRSCLVSAFCCGILAGTFLIPLCYYAYTFLLGRNFFLLDVGIFVVSTLAAFWLFYRLAQSCRLKSHSRLLAFLVCVLFVCFLVFTFRPPALKIFEDPQGSLKANAPTQ